MDQKEVLKAILNVKKYTKNLKQNATNLQQQTATFFSSNNAKTDNNIPLTYSSTIGFYKSKEMMQTPSTGLIPKERSNDDIVSHRKVKGMSKIQKPSESVFATDGKLFHSKQKHILSETQKSNKTDNYENSNKNINKITTKNLANILNSSLQNKESIKKYPNNGHSHTYTHLNNADFASTSNFNTSKSKILINAMGKMHLHSRSPTSRHKERTQLNVQSISSFTNQIKIDSQVEQNCELQADRNGKEKLLEKIKNLQMVICNYQKVLLKVKEKYFQMEKQMSEKAFKDQLVDLLKAEIQVITRKNEKLQTIIDSQKQKIDCFQKSFLQSLRKIQQRYIQESKNTKQIKSQNQFLKKLLFCTQIQSRFLQNGTNTIPIFQSDINKQLISAKSIEQMRLKYKTHS